MSIAEKLQTIAENEQRVYNVGFEDGKSSAVMTGTITFTDSTKVMSITGLPSPPKELNITAMAASVPPSDDLYWVRGLDYYKDGFYYGTSTLKILACVWLGVTSNVATTGASNGTISERHSNNNNVFSFENGTFTIDLTYNPLYFFGENYSYKWTAIF